jgi:phenylpropionate dioxygenase-like ring-hydroxylating dioxygenase large terminal subunit
MFVNQSRLRHILTPPQYYSEVQHQREMQRLFLPGWHLVASVTDLPRPGDFLTQQLLERPLLLRNVDGEICAYLNVCAHRHCLLTHKPRGFDPHFRCQYHGWEYEKTGRTGKIPDAQCFRPWDRENASLTRFRTARCGDLVFLSMAENGPDLTEYLGPLSSTFAEWYSYPYRCVWRWQLDYACNWKLPIENTVESYHIPCLHPKTFREFPKEANILHGLHEKYTSFSTDEMDDVWKRAILRTVKRLGLPLTARYTHHLIHPNLIFVGMDVFTMAQLFVPTSPTTCRTVVWLFTPHGPKKGPLAWFFAKATKWIARLITKKILSEDGPIFPDAQRGMEASTFPGVLGTREERVYLFQEFVANRCGPLDDAE